MVHAQQTVGIFRYIQFFWIRVVWSRVQCHSLF